MLKRIFIAISLAAAIVTLAAIVLSVIPVSQSVQAAPEAQAFTRRPVWRYLDTNGDGTGTITITGNYSPTEIFYLQPPANASYILDSLIVTIEDSQVITSGYYGGIVLTNGILIRRVSGISIITLTDSINILAGHDWRRFCEVDLTAYTTTNNQLQAICQLPNVHLNGDRSERLEVLVEDDFSGLDVHYFIAKGYQQ